ncbi:putative mitochondrial uncoupling protein 5 [Iris pallida]|uniref:Mitochondrial uncoupling protein 5 n=1 Tax=Iris pallida TaxID=29817 RepID=A0AAX6DGI1_IRIPA|nr:putative mitochondrial uncoupling protein 5 [Iris pallida]
MGLYDMMKKRWTSSDSGQFPLPRKIAAGLLAGGIGAAVGNPADVAMVRMQADGRLPVSERRNYRSAADAISRMVRSEGIGSLARERAHRQPGDDRDGEPAVDVRRGEGGDRAEGGHGGRAGDARDGGGGGGGGGDVEPGGRDQDEGDEHEGGEGGAAAVLGGAGLRDEDGEGGGADGALQGVHTDGVEAGALHCRAVRHSGTGQEAAQGLLTGVRRCPVPPTGGGPL